MSVNPLETYLTELRETRDSSAATKETSGYGTLAKPLDAVGHSLKPKVQCPIQLQNSGAGLPDGGLFTPNQLKNADEDAPLRGLNPARGVIEVKAASEELADIAPTPQVKEYLAHYGQVLLTNYRDFLLLKRGPGGVMQPLESFRLADSEAAFWAAAAYPREAADALFRDALSRLYEVGTEGQPVVPLAHYISYIFAAQRATTLTGGHVSLASYIEDNAVCLRQIRLQSIDRRRTWSRR